MTGTKKTRMSPPGWTSFECVSPGYWWFREHTNAPARTIVQVTSGGEVWVIASDKPVPPALCRRGEWQLVAACSR